MSIIPFRISPIDEFIVAIYIRKSRKDKDKKGYRLEVQREDLPAHARSQGWHNIVIYDEGFASAGKGKASKLKERARLEQDILAGKIHLVLVIEVSRISRDDSLIDYVYWLDLCKRKKVKIATPSMTYNLDDPTHWTMLTMGGVSSSSEIQMTSLRMKEGREKAIHKGDYLGGTPPEPYIYDHKLKLPVIDNEKLLFMEDLWKRAETQSARSIAKELKKPEIFVRRALSDERLLFCQALREDRLNEILIKCKWEPCLTQEQAERIKAARRTRNKGCVRRDAAALLSNLNLLYCGYCGRTVKTWNNSKIRKDGSRLDYYGCQLKNDKGACSKSRLIPQTVIDRRVIGNLFNTLARLEELKKYWIDEQSKGDDDKKLVDKLITREKALNEEKERLLKAIRIGVIDPYDAKTNMDQIKSDLVLIKVEREKLLAAVKTEPDWEALDFTEAEYQLLDFYDKRLLIKSVFDKIEVFENYALIHYKFPCRLNSRISRIHLPLPKRGTKTGRKPRYEIKST